MRRRRAERGEHHEEQRKQEKEEEEEEENEDDQVDSNPVRFLSSSTSSRRAAPSAASVPNSSTATHPFDNSISGESKRRARTRRRPEQEEAEEETAATMRGKERGGRGGGGRDKRDSVRARPPPPPTPPSSSSALRRSSRSRKVASWVLDAMRTNDDEEEEEEDSAMAAAPSSMPPPSPITSRRVNGTEDSTKDVAKAPATQAVVGSVGGGSSASPLRRSSSSASNFLSHHQHLQFGEHVPEQEGLQQHHRRVDSTSRMRMQTADRRRMDTNHSNHDDQSPKQGFYPQISPLRVRGSALAAAGSSSDAPSSPMTSPRRSRRLQEESIASSLRQQTGSTNMMASSTSLPRLPSPAALFGSSRLVTPADPDASTHSSPLTPARRSSRRGELASHSSLSDALGTDMPCAHVRLPDLSRARDWLLDPSRWHCEVCETTASSLVCLHCPFVGCGDEESGHMLLHAQETRHWMCIDINEQNVICLACNVPVPLDAVDASGSRFPALRALKRLLDDLSDELQDPPQQPEHAETKSEPLAFSSPFSPTYGRPRRQSSIFSRSAAEFERRDMMVTMLRRWKLLPLSKAFTVWREYTQRTRDADAQVTGASAVARGSRSTLSVTGEKSDVLNTSLDDSFFVASALTKSPQKQQQQQSRSSEATPLPRVALRNLGNTCYLNAVIQALHSTQLVRRFFLHPELLSRELERQSEERAKSLQHSMAMHSEDDVFQLVQRRSDATARPSNDALSREVHNLFRLLKSRHSALLTPYSLLGSVWRQLPTFANHRQHDASEFLSLFLDHLSEELSGSSAKSTLKTHIFSGVLSTSIRCSRCRVTHPSTEEPFFEVGLDIPLTKHVPAGRRAAAASVSPSSSTSLTELLQLFCADEPIEFRCPRCSKAENVNAIRQQRMKQLPNVLVFQIKRFVWLQDRRTGGKLATSVSFPIPPSLLDMRPYLDHNAASSDFGSSHFALRAVVVHEGSRLSSGHYYTYGWDHHGGAWVNYNDAKVSVVSKEKVEACEPYLLFYERSEQKQMAPQQLRASISFLSTALEPGLFDAVDSKRTKRPRQGEPLPPPTPKRPK